MKNRSPPEAVQEPERLLSITNAPIIYKPFDLHRKFEAQADLGTWVIIL